MEALWKVEDKLQLTTKEATLLFACTAFAAIAVCTATILKRRRKKSSWSSSPQTNQIIFNHNLDSDPLGSNHWITIRKVLMGSMRWSEANYNDDAVHGVESWRREMVRPTSSDATTLLRGIERSESSVGRQSHNSVSPVWQRPILMGEKCELPSYSGVILYDERGRLLDHSLTSSKKEFVDQEKEATVTRTTLRDLL